MRGSFHVTPPSLRRTSRKSGVRGWGLTPSLPLISRGSEQHLPLHRPQFLRLEHEGVPKDRPEGCPLRLRVAERAGLGGLGSGSALTMPVHRDPHSTGRGPTAGRQHPSEMQGCSGVWAFGAGLGGLGGADPRPWASRAGLWPRLLATALCLPSSVHLPRALSPPSLPALGATLVTHRPHSDVWMSPTTSDLLLLICKVE